LELCRRDSSGFFQSNYKAITFHTSTDVLEKLICGRAHDKKRSHCSTAFQVWSSCAVLRNFCVNTVYKNRLV